jgi:hypothetical protein
MKSTTTATSRRASRVPAANPTATITLTMDRAQLDLMLCYIESTAVSGLLKARDLNLSIRDRATCERMLHFAAEQVAAGKDEQSMAYELLKLAPVYRAMLAEWKEKGTEFNICRHSAEEDPDLAGTIRAAIG